MNKRNPGLSLRAVQGSFRKNSNDSWISDRIAKAVCFLSPLYRLLRSSRFHRSGDIRSSIHKSICGDDTVLTKKFKLFLIDYFIDETSIKSIYPTYFFFAGITRYV